MHDARNLTYYQNRRQKKNGKKSSTNDKLFFNILLLLVAGVVFYLVFPLINPIIIGTLTATVFYSFNCKVMEKCGNRRMLGAVTSTSAIVLLVFVPLIIFLYMAVEQGIDLTNATSEYLHSEEFNKVASKVTEHKYFNLVKEKLNIGQEAFTTDSENIIGPLKKFLADASTKVFGILSMAGTMIFNLMITLLTMFYVFFDGDRILCYIRHLSPLPHSQEERLINRIRSVSRSSIQGTFLTACCQGIVAMAGLIIVGIPAMFLGTLIGLSSVIPVVGTAVVLVPLLGYLLIVGQGGTALFLLIWSLVFNNVVDYMIRPILMKGEGNMPTVLLLFAIIGGVGRFGLLGFVYGPVAFGIMAVMLWIYEERNSLFLNAQDVK